MGLPIGFDSVLCAVEMSARSKASLYNAIALTHAQGCLTAFLVAPSSRPRDPDIEQRELRDALHEFIAEQVPPSYPHTPPLFAQVAHGDPAQSILLAAHHGQYELIVMSDRAHNRMKDALIEPIVDTVLRGARIPVLVTPACGSEIVSLEPSGPVFHSGRVLVAVDLAQDNADVLETAAMLRTATRDPLLVFAVNVSGSVAVSEGDLRAMVESLLMPEDTQVAVIDASSLAAGVRMIVDREDAGLVVMGPQAGRRRLTAGSLAYEVLHQNRTLVLCVPPSDPAFADVDVNRGERVEVVRDQPPVDSTIDSIRRSGTSQMRDTTR